MIDYIANRIFKNWKTTLISLLGFGLISYLGVKQMVDWTTLSGWFGSAFLVLFLKDPPATKE